MTGDDFAAIGQVLHRYCYAMDERQWSEMDKVFLPDAEFVLGGRMLTGRDIGVGIIRSFIECCSETHHSNTNMLVLSEQDGTAHVVSNFRAWHRGKGKRQDETLECLGTYTDDFVKTSEGWRIARRDEGNPIEFGRMDDFFSDVIGLLRSA